MKLSLIVEVWQMVKESIISTDRDTVAENLVTILIDNDYSPAEIKSAFRDDYDVASALKYHVDDAVDLEDDVEEDDFYEDYDDQEDDESY